MEDYMKINQERWNELVPIHARSAFYDLAGFKAGKNALHPLLIDELGDVSGKSLLHLQCHFGMDTLSWARLGAKVTGVDFSDEAIKLARSLSQELGIEANFICSNIYDLPNVLSAAQKFDIVFTSFGAISWLPDLQPWGKIIAHYLKPGGTFYIAEGHPFMWTFDNSPDFKIAYSYFSHEPIKEEAEGSYADENAKIVHTTEYGWNHSFTEIFNSLISAGLKIDFLHEFPFCAWKAFPNMEKGEDGWWRIKETEKANLIPLTFSLKATKE